MKLIRSLQEWDGSWRGGALTIGNFDGVHRGHARIIERLVAHARRVNGPAIVFTFDPHPAQLLRPDKAPPALVWTQRKAELLKKLGVDHLVVYQTNHALLALEPLDFFDQVVVHHLGARAVVEGPNFFFGKARAGNVQLLEQLCRLRGIDLEIVEPLEWDGDTISSSRIRQQIASGDVQSAWAMLTEPYRLRGKVHAGAARGRTIGFPTANLEQIDTIVPAMGVYAGWAYPEGERWPAAIHLGTNPTFADHRPKLEVHIIGYAGDLYGQPLEVDFLARLRDIQKFPDITALQQQLQRDLEAARSVCHASSLIPPALTP